MPHFKKKYAVTRQSCRYYMSKLKSLYSIYAIFVLVLKINSPKDLLTVNILLYVFTLSDIVLICFYINAMMSLSRTRVPSPMRD